MSYKDVPLFGDLVQPKLAEFADGSVTFQAKGNACHYSFSKNGKPVLLVVHPKNSGLFTLQAAGKNVDLANEAAEYVIENARSVQAKNFSLSIKDYDDEKFDLLKGYLIEECGAEQEGEAETKANGVVTKIKGKQGDVLTFTLFRNGTLQIQGRPVVLAIELIQYLSEDETVSQEELLGHLGVVFSTTPCVDEANARLATEYPNAYAYAGDNLKKILSAAVTVRGIPVEVADYSVISYPALRALESFMLKSVLMACNQSWVDFADVFDKVSSAPLKFEVNQVTKNELQCGLTCSLLGECYSYYAPHRHGTFHAGGFDGNIRIIENRAEALGISETCLTLINNYSKQLLEKK